MSISYNQPRTPSPLRKSISAEDLQEEKGIIRNFSKKISDCSLSVFIEHDPSLAKKTQKNRDIKIQFKTAIATERPINSNDSNKIKLLNIHLKLARISLEVNEGEFERAKNEESALIEECIDYVNGDGGSHFSEVKINKLFDAMSHSISCKKNIRDDKNEINQILLKISEIKK